MGFMLIISCNTKTDFILRMITALKGLVFLTKHILYYYYFSSRRKEFMTIYVCFMFPLYSMKEDKIEVDICTPQCETDKLCLPKCCNLWDDVSFRNNTVICVPSLEGKVWHPMISDDNDFSSEVQMDPSKIQYFIRDPSSSRECTIVRLVKYLHFE